MTQTCRKPTGKHSACGILALRWSDAWRAPRNLGRFGLPGHGFGAAAEAGHPLALDGVGAAAPARPAAPAEDVARPAEPGVEGVRGVVESADAAGLTDGLLELGQPPGAAGREPTSGRLESLGDGGGGRLHDLLRRQTRRAIDFPIGTFASSA